MPRRPHTDPWIRRTSLICLLFSIILQGTLAFAVPMQNDPNGFEGIPWGATFSETDTFMKVEDAGRSQTYELKTGAPSLGPVKVDSMRFVTSEGKFACHRPLPRQGDPRSNSRLSPIPLWLARSHTGADRRRLCQIL